MSVSIRWLEGPAAVLREHADGQGYGDPTEWSCTVERDGETAILHAAPGAPRSRAEIAEALRAEGFTRVRWLRQDGRGWRDHPL